MKVTLAQIRAFERIVRLGSFHAAARELHLTQPSVSQRIRELEDSLGVQLFVRRGPRISLTADGTALITYADRLLGTTDEMVGLFRAGERLSGFLRIGVTESFGIAFLPELLRRLGKHFPTLQTVTQVGDSDVNSRLLGEGQIDVAITYKPDADNHILCEQIGISQLGWFAHAGADLPPGPYTPDDLSSQHIVVTPPHTRLYLTTTRWFVRAGAVPNRMSTCNSLTVNIRAITSGLGIGVVPVIAMQDHVASGAAKQLQVSPAIPEDCMWVCHKVQAPGPAMTRLIEVVRDVVSHYKLVA